MEQATPSKEQILSYISGLCDSETAETVELWFYRNGKTEEAAETLRPVWEDILSKDYSAERTATRLAFSRFTGRIKPGQYKKRQSFPKFREWARLGAAMLLIPLCILSFQLYRKHIAKENIEWTGKYVAMGSIDTLTMPDGTTVWLNSGSHIFYPEKFSGSARQVYLDGEGVFHVAHDKNRPMIIRTDKASVKVLGTKFNLKAYSEEKITEVSLLEGSVEFYAQGEGMPICRLSPGDAVAYDKETCETTESRFSPEDYTSWKDRKYYFKNKSLAYIARQLERTFDVTIIIRNDKLPDTKYHMAFVNNENIDEILQYIRLHDNMSIERNGNIIEIW